jgi:hypothetical protein
MSRLVKDYIDIADFTSLDTLIERLTELRDGLPAGAEAELRIRGDEVFGRHLSISYQRAQTEEEAACEARYADAYQQSRALELSRLQDEIGYCELPQRRGRRLRAVA